MKEITPPKLIPFDQSKLASGMLPIEQTKDAMAMIGPTAAFSMSRSQSLPVSMNKAFHQLTGTRAERNPAMRKPPKISFQSIDQSIQKALATRVHFPPRVS